MDKKWKVLASEDIFRNRFMRFRKDRCRLPDGKEMPSYFVLEFTDWVNVVPLTDDGQIVLIKQYRHASGEVCIEIPGGSVDPGEEHHAAGARELEEETGHVARELKYLGSHRPNPALQNNRMHTYVAFGCRKEKPLHLDPFEDIEVFTAPVKEVLHMIMDGRINHSIILASLLKALPDLGVKII